MLPGISRGRVSLIRIESAEPNFHDIQRTQNGTARAYQEQKQYGDEGLTNNESALR